MIIGHVHGHMRMADCETVPYSFLIGSRILALKVKLIYVHVTLSCRSHVCGLLIFSIRNPKSKCDRRIKLTFFGIEFCTPHFGEFPHRLQTIINNISFSFFFSFILLPFCKLSFCHLR